MTSGPQNALTVDVEDYFHVAALADAIPRDEWDRLSPRVEANTYRLLDIFDDSDVRATFFVLGWVADRFPKLVKEIHSRGHEVASHGYSHQLVYKQTPSDFEAETVRSKEMLEELIGAAVLGYRAASYSITKQSLWALDIIAKAGFQYDSSVVPVRHDLYGIPGAKSVPHELSTHSGQKVVEFPPTTLEYFGMSLPVAGGGYFRLYPYWLTSYFLRQINERLGQPFIFYLHPWEIDPEQPRIRTKLRSRIRHYLNLDKTECRLKQMLSEFKFDTVAATLRDLSLLAA